MVYRRSDRSERVRTASRARILRAAERLFLRRGYEATTMQEIAQRARTSIGNLYFYFVNKEQLFGTLLEEAATAAWGWVDAAMSDVPPGPQRLAVMVYGNSRQLLGEKPDLMRILLLDESAARLRVRVQRKYAARIQSYLVANIPAALPERIDLAVAAWLGAGRGVLEQSLSGARKAERYEEAEFLVRWNLRALRVADGEIEAAIGTARKVIGDRDEEEMGDG